MMTAELEKLRVEARAEAKKIRATHLLNIALAVAAKSKELGKATDLAEAAIANAIFLAASRSPSRATEKGG